MLGGVLYVIYCFLVVAAADSIDVLPNQLYLASALLWLLGSGALVQGSYPENVLALAKKAEADAADGGLRRNALVFVERYCTDSAVLVGAYGLGIGAPTFLAGAAAAIAAASQAPACGRSAHSATATCTARRRTRPDRRPGALASGTATLCRLREVAYDELAVRVKSA